MPRPPAPHNRDAPREGPVLKGISVEHVRGRELRVHSTGMHSGSEHKEFFFEEQAVGYFEDQLPSTPGHYRYTPFRGFGHLRLVEALASLGSQRCYYMHEGKKHYFIVLKASGPGLLVVHAHKPERVSE